MIDIIKVYAAYSVIIHQNQLKLNESQLLFWLIKCTLLAKSFFISMPPLCRKSSKQYKLHEAITILCPQSGHINLPVYCYICPPGRHNNLYLFLRSPLSGYL